MNYNKPTGIGVPNYTLAFCINNRPALDDYSRYNGMRQLQQGELHHIVHNTSNHWRKLFNVFAKTLAELDWFERTGQPCARWQDYRDRHLLQGHSQEALLFTPPTLNPRQVHIIAGKTYGFSLPWAEQAKAIESDIFVFPEGRAVICPYMDYRQLTNQKILRVAEIVADWL